MDTGTPEKYTRNFKLYNIFSEENIREKEQLTLLEQLTLFNLIEQGMEAFIRYTPYPPYINYGIPVKRRKIVE